MRRMSYLVLAVLCGWPVLAGAEPCETEKARVAQQAQIIALHRNNLEASAASLLVEIEQLKQQVAALQAKVPVEATPTPKSESK